jgi:hypothetical protein
VHLSCHHVSHPGPVEWTLRVEGLVNVRDLGGLRRRNGTLTPSGVFYRSENVDTVTPAGWDELFAEESMVRGDPVTRDESLGTVSHWRLARHCI